MVVVTHEMGFAREVGDQADVHGRGRIIEDGVPKEVFANPKDERFKAFLAHVL